MRIKDVWKRILPLQVGTKVKVKQIYTVKRLQLFPWLVEFIGMEGTIIQVSQGIFDRKRVNSYIVFFGKSHKREEWCFEEEDLEIIGYEETKH